MIGTGFTSGRQLKPAAGGMLPRTTAIPLARANSTIDMMLFLKSRAVSGPVLPAMSLVPARMCTVPGATRPRPRGSAPASARSSGR